MMREVWFERVAVIFNEIPWLDTGIAEIWLEERSHHLGTLLRESIEDETDLSPEIIALAAEDWVLYEEDR